MTQFEKVTDTRKTDDTPEFTKPEADDFYMLSYTSGTTGDSKGVKMTHNMIIKQCMAGYHVMGATEGDSILSYLPYAHSMEQNMFCQSLIHKLRIGYYSGDPLKLVEDCQILKPIFFASVPRLWTRIY